MWTQANHILARATTDLGPRGGGRRGDSGRRSRVGKDEHY